MRDLRDPQKLGEVLVEQAKHVRRHYGNDIPLSEIYDVHVCHFDISDYDHGESLATITARKYRAELQERAANGDKYAKSVLAGYRNDDPAGD